MPCSPSDVSVKLPESSTADPIAGFGVPSSLKIPNVSPNVDGFPEDLVDILNKLQLIIPPGALKPQLNPNFGKDIYDGIMKLLDQFMPFLMLYKFFLPVLNIIICIIEVLCSLMNPFALIRAITRLFRTCIPELLAIFPVFAMIIMAISLLLLLLSLIEYLVEQVLKLVKILLRNINALNNAFQSNNENGVLAIAKKIGALLCMFQNLFVLFAVFNIIIQVIKDILKMAFAIPPCEDAPSGDTNSCCTPETCPVIVQANYTRLTGNFKYLNSVGSTTIIPNFNVNMRNESWQIYDLGQEQAQQFRNIFDAFDVLFLPKPIFFPTDSTYTALTDYRQAPYLVDMRLFYTPADWGRVGLPRFIKFTNCIMTKVPTTSLLEGDNTTQAVNNGVGILAGGTGFEDDALTPLYGFASDGTTAIGDKATLENFFHMPAQYSLIPTLSINDGYAFQNIEYTFKPNSAPLLQKNIISIGCVPDVALSKTFINNVFAGDIGIKSQQLINLNFPDPAAAQECLATAVSALRFDLTAAGVAQFQSMTDICLQKLKDDTIVALSDLIGIGFDPCKSSFDLTPAAQFTTKPIVVSVSLNEKNGISLTTGLSKDISDGLANRIRAHNTFGDVSNFKYDGNQFFTANITSNSPGLGELMISFDNNIFCTDTIPTDITIAPSHDLQVKNYQFIYTSAMPPTAEGDTDGAPRRDDGDRSRDASGDGSKDGV